MSKESLGQYSSLPATLLDALTVFTGAFLLFQIQPMIAKFILPWFGGAPAVWTTSLVFFQGVLFFGYFYAHALNRLFPVKAQAIVQIALLILSASLLDIVPTVEWKPGGHEEPILHILTLLGVHIGLPYFLLASTSPLIQSWFSIRQTDGSAYRFYSLSNVGSLLALLSYPFIVEPAFTTGAQLQSWSWIYYAFTIFFVGAGVLMLGVENKRREHAKPLGADAGAKPSNSKQTLWFLLAACGSLLLLAITNHISHDIAAVPFLWVIPLSIYLLTFILTFESDRWYSRQYYLLALCMLVLLLLDTGAGGVNANILLALLISFVTLFVSCMVCHGELVSLRPATSYLTKFYLMVSAGGAVGGLFVGLIAPYLFNSYVELEIGLIGLGLMILLIIYNDRHWFLYKGEPKNWWLLAVGIYVLLAGAIVFQALYKRQGIVVSDRSFYGTTRVAEAKLEDSNERVRLQLHGRIVHGFQFLKEGKRGLATGYFESGSGIGRALQVFQKRGPVKVGIIGLGVGTVAAYGRVGDEFRFYEINSDVIRQAENDFTFLSDSKATNRIILGDGRLSLEREAKQEFDILFLDAFSSDSIPMHLLTKEAMQVYLGHLKPGGALVFQITNRHLDLAPLLWEFADHFSLAGGLVHYKSELSEHNVESRMMVLSADTELMAEKLFTEAMQAKPKTPSTLEMWTDDFSNLFSVLKFD